MDVVAPGSFVGAPRAASQLATADHLGELRFHEAAHWQNERHEKATLLMKAVTAQEMREVDRLTTERRHISGLQLMEAAGKQVADAVLRSRTSPAYLRIVVLCGKGNNGGDGLVCARHLKNAGLDPRVWFFAAEPQQAGAAAENFKLWQHAGGATTFIPDEAAWDKKLSALRRAQIVIDAILGTGLRGAPEGAIARAIADLNRISKNATAANPMLILAVDTPSGLPSDGEPAAGPVLTAHRTITFTAPKIGHLESPQAASVGALEVVQIGSPRALVEEIAKSDLQWAELREFANLPLVRAWDSNKGMYGHALLIAGSIGKSGAAILAGSAALRGGAGLVTVATPVPLISIVAAAHPEYMIEPLEATENGAVASRNLHAPRFEEILKKKTVLGIGPGLGMDPETQEFVRTVTRETEIPLILDADALNAFAGNAGALRDRKSKFLAVTPHPGEMARLCGKSTKEVQASRLKTARDAACDWNVHIVLKGFHTIIAAPDGKIFVNTTGNPGLAKGGSGDVLTGFLTALTAQFGAEDWLRILALGVYLHGRAAELATATTDISGLLSSELVNALPHARAKLLEELRQLV
jgi:ADP-dependent NAD(P)H-hydrate dehydratase / NAD(P)H-hydrate epimerase